VGLAAETHLSFHKNKNSDEGSILKADESVTWLRAISEKGRMTKENKIRKRSLIYAKE
jgi:hypothetical protein